ncbi:MAG: hypothetical protein H0W86_09860 [Armatimonadetes bacterium]|nr:hypothetical protein [Armatimonadota bacterium]
MDDAAVDALLVVAPSTVATTDQMCFFLNAKTIAPFERPEYLSQWVKRPDGQRALSDFQQIPGTPFAYEKPRELLHLWRNPHRLEPDLATVATGGKTFDDERFLRLRWEVSPQACGDRWLSVDTGGDYQPWVSPSVFTEDWENEGKAVRENAIARHGTSAQVMQSSKLWFKAGLAYPYTSSIGFGPRIFPKGTILSTDAIAISPNRGIDRLVLLGALATSWAGELLTVFGDHRKTENSSVKSLPIRLSEGDTQKIRQLAETAVRHVQWVESLRENSPYFIRPSKEGEVTTLAEVLRRVQRELDNLCRRMFSISSGYHLNVDHGALIPTFIAEPDKSQHLVLLLSYCVGAAVGRWDIRVLANQEPEIQLPDVFACLPLCPPGMLQGTDGIPLAKSPDGYPLRIAWNGILVDDPEHFDDIVRYVRDVLEAGWKGRAEAIEKEACEILGIKELRDYFRRTAAGGFWGDHVKRYSKSHRKAPIYWLLQSSKKNYAFWLYYHRLNKDLLFKALANYVEPKIQRETNRLDEMRRQKQTSSDSGSKVKKIGKDIERQEDLISELRDFEDKLRRAANLCLVPDLNDGVVLNIAPLHELVPWKEAKNYWEELLEGKYEWSSIGNQLRQKGIVK